MAITARQFLERFPEFQKVGEGKINAVIAEVAPGIGVTWMEADREPAMKYLVAHILAASGEPHLSAATSAGGVYQGVVKRRKVGDVEVEFAQVGAGAASLDYSSTFYGAQYLAIARRNFPTIAVV